jgi:hypothetical protein
VAARHDDDLLRLAGLLVGGDGQLGGDQVIAHGHQPAMKSARTRARRLSCPLTSGTWQTTAFTRRSMAPTTSVWPPE